MRFTTGSLQDPEVNVRLGMQYFKDLIDRFGGDYFAIASYNAGENRVAQWRAERPDLAEDEFIDDIPFPETQNYVKRILGTAEDYRRLYGPEGSGGTDAVPAVSHAPAPAASNAKASAAGKPAPKKKASPKKKSIVRKAKKAA